MGISNKRKVLLFALESINNVGDEMLRATTEYLVTSQCDEYDVIVSQLKPTLNQIPFPYKIIYIFGILIRRISMCFGGTLKYKILHISYVLKFYLLFKGKIKKSDRIILPIGMLKYGTQDFSYVFNIIIQLALVYQRPVLMSAMSPQIPKDTRDWRYNQLKRTVNSRCVQSVTTRDGVDGTNIIKEYYVKNENVVVDYVGDPALWIPECYGYPSKKIICNKVPNVGINIIRTDIFEDYNKELNSNDLFNFYVDLIQEVKKRGWNWFVFTNGMKNDNDVIEKLKEVITIPVERIMKSPDSGKEYVSKVFEFDVVFGARLHSCITSVALGIPVVGFVWDEKLKFFSKTMKIEDRFFCPKDMSANRVVEKMEMVLGLDYDLDNRDSYKERVKSSIQKFLK